MKTILGSLVAIAALACPSSALAQPGPNQPDTMIDAKTRTEIIAALAKGLKDAYVFPDVGDNVAEMLQARNARGEYNSITSASAFVDLVTKQMQEATSDKHLRLMYSSRALPSIPAFTPGVLPPPAARELVQRRVNNYEFERVEHFPGNVGYVKLDAFMDAARGGSVAAGAMAFVANSDALIVDLRQNGGGEPSMVALLASYFFNDGVHLSDLAYRLEGTRDYETTQMWTSAYVPGERYLDKDVYILTSRRTFSAAEEFTYDLQALKRATVVGETTAGGANPVAPYRLSDHFYAGIPRGHSINPVTKTNWEGKGIKPDVEVPEADALKTARRLALQRLIEKTTDAQRLTSLKQSLASLDAER